MKKVRYDAPEVEVLDVLVEAGFAASDLEDTTFEEPTNKPERFW